MRDRGRKLAERGEARHPVQVSVGILQRILGHLPLRDVRASADHALSVSILAHRRAARQEPPDAAIAVNHPVFHFVIRTSPVEMITNALS